MSHRKTFDSEIPSDRHVMILQNRRKDEVKKNFAIGIQRVETGKHSGVSQSLKARGKI